MDSKIKSSFIPDKSLTRSSRGGAGRNTGGLGDIIFLLSVVIIAAVLALAAGVFLYNQFLVANVAKKSVLVNKARESFDPVFIQNMTRLDERLKVASVILENHLAPSEVFKILQELTLQSVKYTSLEYKIGDDGIIHIYMDGLAQSVNGVALQSSVFGAQNAISDLIFSDLNLTDTRVSFKVSVILNPLALQYDIIAKKRADASSLVPSTEQKTPPDTIGNDTGSAFGLTPVETTQTQ